MMKLNTQNIISWIVLIIVAILAFKCGRSCNRPKVEQPMKTVVKTDTVFVKDKSDTVYVPELVKLKPSNPLPIWIVDTIYLESFQHIDTAFILKDYFARAIYSDTQKVKYGSIIINDTVTQNRIASRGLQTNFNIPIITKTVTLTEPKRTQIYFGLDGMSDFKHNVYAGFSGALRSKKGGIWEAGAMYGNDNNLYFFGSRKFLIHFGSR